MSTILRYEAQTTWFDEGRYKVTKPRDQWLSPELLSVSECRFCGQKMQTVASKGEPTGGFFNLVFACETCGWWNAEGADSADLRDGTALIREALVVGHLRSYEVSDPWVPLALLRSEIAKRPALSYETNPTVWERLIGAVLSEANECQVIHVGRSGDGGIDLLMVDSDSPAAIQVKRREKPGSVEQVRLVREFLGAILLEGFKRGILVTNADRYSKPAKNAAAKAQALGLADHIDLLDLRKVVDLLRSTTETAEPWLQYCDTQWLHSSVGY